MVPSRFVFPDWNSRASVSDVFPVPRWPTTATLRIFPGSSTAMRFLLRGTTGSPDLNGASACHPAPTLSPFRHAGQTSVTEMQQIVGCLDRFEQRDLIPALARDRPELVERRDRRARDRSEAVLELLGRDADFGRDLLVRRSAAEPRLEVGDRPLDLARARSHRPRHP